MAIDSCPDGTKDVAFAAVDLAGKRVTLATFGPLDEIARNVRQDVLLAQQQQKSKMLPYSGSFFSSHSEITIF